MSEYQKLMSEVSREFKEELLMNDTDKRYPLCERAGLRIIPTLEPQLSSPAVYRDCVRASDVEAYLAKHSAPEPRDPAPQFFRASDFADLASRTWQDSIACRANRILAERGTRVYATPHPDSLARDESAQWTRERCPQDTHTALLIGVTKIEPDSWAKFAEDILKEDFTRERLYKRAKELLNG